MEKKKKQNKIVVYLLFGNKLEYVDFYILPTEKILADMSKIIGAENWIDKFQLFCFSAADLTFVNI